jgi:hypothetical protein
MELTAEQRDIARRLAEACARAGAGARIVYQTEYLGWLPFGQYHWVDVESADGKESVSNHFPDGWAREDLLRIESAGLLRRVGEAREDADDLHRIVYEMTEEG